MFRDVKTFTICLSEQSLPVLLQAWPLIVEEDLFREDEEAFLPTQQDHLFPVLILLSPSADRQLRSLRCPEKQLQLRQL